MATPEDIDAVKAHLKRVQKNQRWRDDFVSKIDAKFKDKNAGSFNALTDVQRKLLAAMDAPDPVPDLEPAISPNLLQPKPEVAPGSLVEVQERAKGRRA